MKPSEYKAQYESLTINLGGGRTTPVKIHRYQRQPADGGVTRKKLTDKVDSKGITDFELKVGPADSLVTVDPELTKTPAFRRMLSAPFSGKGAPQHCQLVLQLVHHFALATNLQEYAENNLGLDCNGFVGNFLWHEWRTNGWTDPGLNAARIDDADRLVDRDCAIAGRIEHGDLTAGVGLGDRLGKRPAWRCKRAGVGVDPLAGNERAGVLGRGASRQEPEKEAHRHHGGCANLPDFAH